MKNRVDLQFISGHSGKLVFAHVNEPKRPLLQNHFNLWNRYKNKSLAKNYSSFYDFLISLISSESIGLVFLLENGYVISKNSTIEEWKTIFKENSKIFIFCNVEEKIPRALLESTEKIDEEIENEIYQLLKKHLELYFDLNSSEYEQEFYRLKKMFYEMHPNCEKYIEEWKKVELPPTLQQDGKKSLFDYLPKNVPTIEELNRCHRELKIIESIVSSNSGNFSSSERCLENNFEMELRKEIQMKVSNFLDNISSQAEFQSNIANLFKKLKEISKDFHLLIRRRNAMNVITPRLEIFTDYLSTLKHIPQVLKFITMEHLCRISMSQFMSEIIMKLKTFENQKNKFQDAFLKGMEESGISKVFLTNMFPLLKSPHPLPDELLNSYDQDEVISELKLHSQDLKTDEHANTIHKQYLDLLFDYISSVENTSGSMSNDSSNMDNTAEILALNIELKQENESLKSKNEELEKNYDDLAMKLISGYKAKDDQIQNLQNELNERIKQIQQLEEYKKNVETHLMENAHDVKIQNLQIEPNDLIKQIQQLEEDRKNLQNELNERIKQIQQLEEDSNNAETNLKLVLEQFEGNSKASHNDKHIDDSNTQLQNEFVEMASKFSYLHQLVTAFQSDVAHAENLEKMKFCVQALIEGMEKIST